MLAAVDVPSKYFYRFPAFLLNRTYVIMHFDLKNVHKRRLKAAIWAHRHYRKIYFQSFINSRQTQPKWNLLAGIDSMLLLKKSFAFVSVTCLKIRFFLQPNSIIHKAYATSQKFSLMHDAMAYVCDIQNMDTRVIVENPAKWWYYVLILGVGTESYWSRYRRLIWYSKVVLMAIITRANNHYMMKCD